MWGRLDDQFHSHPKVLALATRTDPIGALVRLWSWSLDHRTGGKLPKAVALAYATAKVLAKLVAVRLLEADGGDFVIHDFTEYGPSAEQSAERAAATSEARRQAGKRGAASRWHRSNPPPATSQTDDNPDGKPMAIAIGG